jgi:quinoprotein glucose dehydrogenase
MYIVSKEIPTFQKLMSPGPSTTAPSAASSGSQEPEKNERGETLLNTAPANAGADFVAYRSPYEWMISGSTGLPAIGPPWSTLTAYDLHKGTILWQIPNGEIAGLPSRTGTPTGSMAPRGGPVATGGGLLFVATASDRKLRAYDEDNGRVLWEYGLPAASEGVPAVYEVDGRQYVAIAVGGAGFLAPRISNQAPPGPSQYMVFALPNRR